VCDNKIPSISKNVTLVIFYSLKRFEPILTIFGLLCS